MPGVLNHARGRHLVADYQSGMTVNEVAAKHGCKAETVCKWMARLGVKARSRKLVIDSARLVAEYTAGKSLNALAMEFGCERGPLLNCLKENGVKIRGRSDAEQLKWAGMTDERKAAQMAMAHKSRPGAYVDDVMAMVTAAGYECEGQFAVGPYDIDIAVHELSVAMEVTCFSPGTFRRTKSRERCEHLLNRGWCVVYLRRPSSQFCRGRAVGTYFDHGFVAEQVVAFLDRARRDPSVRGKYRVLHCHPEFSPALGYDLDGLPAVV